MKWLNLRSNISAKNFDQLNFYQHKTHVKNIDKQATTFWDKTLWWMVGVGGDGGGGGGGGRPFAVMLIRNENVKYFYL